MGISGLLPLLKSIHTNAHIKQYSGKVVGIDGYVWLHRGAFGCASDLALGNPTTKYVDYAMHRIKMFRHYGVEPYVVFDGDYLPSKLWTEDSRASKRAEYLSAGMRYHAQGQSSKATEQFKKCIDVTPEMAYRLILALRREGIAYVVAPYEADAQLAYLEKRGIIQAIVTEDSDLLVFGCKTLLVKMSKFGDCEEIKRERFANVTTLHGFTDDDFRHMAILSGCDYLPSINGVGLITANRLLRRFNKNVKRVVQSLRLQVGTQVPPDYLEAFDRANLTFKHQRVFCPEKECLVMWNEPTETLTDELLIYIGPDLDVEIARGVATGHLHPMTKKTLGLPAEGWENSIPQPLNKQVRGSSYKPKPPTPVKSKSIRSFFSPRSKSRSQSLQDVTEKTIKRDAERGNTPITPEKLWKSQSAAKRSFTVVESEERLAVKRARKYLGGDDEITSAVKSPFFASVGKTQLGKRAANAVKEVAIVLKGCWEMRPTIHDSADENDDNILPVDEAIVIHDSAEEKEDDILPVDTTSGVEDEPPQVQESPPPIKQPTVTDDEVIPDSPSDAIRIRALTGMQSFMYKAVHVERPSTLPPSPPSSRPTISCPSSTRPILRPGIAKKAYTPRPSSMKKDIFPDTPDTPTPQQASLIQSWKERFSGSFAFSASALMPPVETPKSRVEPLKGRLKPVTPGMARRPASRGVEWKHLKLAGMDQIEGSPPKRPRTSLDQFRFIPM